LTITAHPKLSLANSMRKLDAREGDGGSSEGLQAEHRGTATFYRTVILLDDVVEIAIATHLDRPPPAIFLPE
jgi:hypothetical protein